ncbi:hypothetical protein [Pontibacter fetidus]|uniref:Lipoprotein n=1 Tax=Pontibacter fetidus TaxID=2700082 RepID=A0A6B2GZ59_9BACT|nr:hypothetical protein [Pontibacter fetidus]NDK55301.1 hypothetical protein [Pontibacter fetidus]
MSRFLKYSYSLVLFLFAFSCNQVQQEEKPVEIPFTQDDLTQIYSLAFDSLLGPSEQWLGAKPLIVDDSVSVEVIFRDTFDGVYPRISNLLSEERYFQRKKSLQKYDGFNTNEFAAIIADSNQQSNNFQGAHIVRSLYKYKPTVVLAHSDSYSIGEPLAAVALGKVTFNKNASYAIIIASYHRGPEWSEGKAYFLKKDNGNWRVVGVNSLFIS